MPIDFFGAALRNSQPEKGSRPMLNQNFMSSGGRFSSYTNFFSGFSFKRYWQWFRTRPELYSIISIPVNDIIGGEVDYYDLDGNPLGRNRLIKAKKFWSDNQMKQVMKGIEFDCHLTGNGFGWLGKIDKDRIEKELDKFANLKYKSLDMDKELFKFKVMQELEKGGKDDADDDLVGPKSYMQVASSTMDIISNQYEIQYYLQRVGGREQRFMPDEIVHFILERLDGRVEGFTPISTMVAEMFLIQMIKDNMIGFFENGGHPSKIYSLPDVKTVNDPSYKRIVDMLSESKTILNSNGSLIYPGKLEVNDLGALPKDMEYKDLAMWVLSNIAFAFEIPTSRMPYLLSGSSGAVNSGGSSGLSDSGYWKRIENRQDYLEDTYNRWLFSKLGFKIRLPRGNKQDEIRETQARVQQYDSVSKLQSIMSTQGLKVNDEVILKMLDLSGDDVAALTTEDVQMQGMIKLGGVPNNTNRQNQLNSMQTMRQEDTVDRSNAKKATASNNGVSS